VHDTGIIEAMTVDGDDGSRVTHRQNQAASKSLVPALTKDAQRFETSAQKSTGLQLSARDA
jgi:hypothetical protein